MVNPKNCYQSYLNTWQCVYLLSKIESVEFLQNFPVSLKSVVSHRLTSKSAKEYVRIRTTMVEYPSRMLYKSVSSSYKMWLYNYTLIIKWS